MTTDIIIKFKGKDYNVPEGFTVEEFRDSLATQFPEAATAKLIEDEKEEGVYELKTTYGDKG